MRYINLRLTYLLTRTGGRESQSKAINSQPSHSGLILDLRYDSVLTPRRQKLLKAGGQIKSYLIADIPDPLNIQWRLFMPPLRQTGRGGGIMFPTCPFVRPSYVRLFATKLVNTTFLKRMNQFSCKMAPVFRGIRA